MTIEHGLITRSVKSSSVGFSLLVSSNGCDPNPGGWIVCEGDRKLVAGVSSRCYRARVLRHDAKTNWPADIKTGRA
jgi:hypothetical protein